MHTARVLLAAPSPGLWSAGRWAIAITLALPGAPFAQESDPQAMVRAFESVLVDTIAGAEGAVVAISRADAMRITRTPDPFDALAPAENRVDDEFHSGSFIPLRFGSGVLVADPADPEARLVLTTFHVAFGDDSPDVTRTVSVTIQLPDIGAVVVPALPHAADRRLDLAVLRLQLDDTQLSPGELRTLPLGNADDVRKGHLVVALGNPYALARDGSPSASVGMISNIGRRPQPPAADRLPRREESIHEYGTLLTVDLRLELGGSGGPLLNLNGEMIGITTALAALQGYEKSAGFAIPLDAGARRIVTQLLRGHEAEYGFLGIAPESARWTRPDGRIVAAVRAAHVALESPAHQAGLRTRDLILQINGRQVSDAADLMRIIGLLGPGASAELLVQRRDEASPRMLTAQLGKWPVVDDADVLSTVPARTPWRGLSVDYPTARQRYLSSDRLEQYRRAVVVTHVEAGSAAASAGVQSGDFISAVDGAEVQTPIGFAEEVLGKAGPVELTFWDGRRLQLEP